MGRGKIADEPWACAIVRFVETLNAVAILHNPTSQERYT
jgi:hypothetical protein